MAEAIFNLNLYSNNNKLKMKKIFFLLIFSAYAITLAQVGINTANPKNMLHIVANGTNDPLRVEGVKAGSGAYLLIDSNGVIKSSTDRSNLTFVLPSVSNSTRLLLTQTGQTGSTTYNENSIPASSITPGNGSWIKISGLQSTLNIIQPSNTINISVEGMVQYDSAAAMTGDMTISYAIGIFLDGKLIATRMFAISGNGFSGTTDKWSVLGQSSNLSVGAHTIEIYATRRNTAGSASADLAIARPAPSVSSLNQFMAKGVLQINGVYQ
ncbi:hypothetical protein SAMN05444267_100884 [Chryseobacterium polytrichastri]|uniref:Uncharacterized protein n=2 Tax=Chryseobacterium polytrichastri TaxID=1302687 RepID=A0A1M6VMV8_9FLAO|nr:hypothetical protein SAMN05444267_100884 [Chryseobacterium polytrichastri]